MSPWTWRRGTVVLGRYEVLDAIHSGNMGIVYRVRHREWNADLAVKIPRADLVATLDGRRAFEAEAGIWATLDLHPHLVSCAYVRRIDELPCVFAEWVDGGSLDVLVQEGRLYLDDHQTTLSRVLDVAVQIAWGIVWDLRSGRCAFTLGGHAAPVTMVMFSADGRWLLSADLTPRIQLWALDWDYEFPPDRS